MGSRKMAYVVDDNRDLALALRAILVKLGFIVRVFHSGVGLDSFFAIERPALVVMDMLLPGASGFDVLRRLESAGALQSTRVIVCSALPEQRLRALGQRPVVYLPKPFTLGQVQRAVADALGQGAPALGAGS